MPNGSGSRLVQQRTPCPNCGSMDFFCTAAEDCCPSCGLRFNYHEGGANQVYRAFEARQIEGAYQEEIARQCLLGRALEEE